MTRLPSADPAGRRVYSVSDVTGMVRRALEEGIPPLMVEGEISNLRRPVSGHFYFTLKDARSQLRCVLFRGFSVGLTFAPEDGMKVVAAGVLNVYEPRGEFQLRVESLQPAGLGDLALAFIQMRDRLQAEGLFDSDRKVPLPVYPETIGLVTSATGAAIQDMIRVLRRRWPPIRLVLRPAPVQGEGAAEKIAGAIEALDEWGGADLIIVGRGGGSLEDLWAFNEEVVARAIFRCHTPIISGVGHEIDVTISDFVADHRAPTPSAAAEHAVPVAEEVREWVVDARIRLDRALLSGISMRKKAVLALARSRALGRPLDLMDQTRQRLDEIFLRMTRGLKTRLSRRAEGLHQMDRRLNSARPIRLLSLCRQRLAEQGRRLREQTAGRVERARQRLEMLDRQMEALGPVEVLRRGFSITLNPEGRIVRDPSDAPEGMALSLILAAGRLRARSEGTDKTGVSMVKEGSKPRVRRSQRREADG
ncbi:MAG: exodeoxyribonuclease VII large subunit [Candidatus Eisenbacteria bacterium]|uniref:Exodeoxyribonuclease 7 large subunit n=1 Tax=Eiseniibacteriota bacterium TaxID=2212470 RepID=A0A948RY38_UNCEI|nr:exodeoxyribonuclease VII large subunit [Candidatus Eisenbacteria bacterium]MBU1949616.1 exodeoxyribonuclease VII large subunit [Candidatus Eisenbacteria bacterium]MBU2690364.1 exodeoxyribonuclease VII large subunit [Candidatus Eisenbacteria bacterium]